MRKGIVSAYNSRICNRPVPSVNPPSLLDSADAKPQAAAAGEYGWSGAHSTTFWVAPKSELFAIVMQQLEPFSFELPLALKPVIYAAIED